MFPVSFPEQTTVVAKDQPEYKPLPAHISSSGALTCCWRLSFRERLWVLFTGHVWQIVLTFHSPLQPQILIVSKPEME